MRSLRDGAVQRDRGPRLEDRPALVRAEFGALGVLVATGVFSLISLALLVIGGRHQTDSHGDSQDVLVLFLGWTIGSAWLGAVLGIAAPWMKRLPVAIAAGPIAVLPLMVGFIAADANGFGHWSRHQTVISLAVSLGVGALLGGGIGRSEKQGVCATRSTASRRR